MSNNELMTKIPRYSFELRAQIVERLQQYTGTNAERAGWASVGIRPNATDWISDESTQTFYNYLVEQLHPLVALEC